MPLKSFNICFRWRGKGPKRKAKISQFQDDTILIWRDIKALKENINFIKKFSATSGLKSNKENTKAMWIDSAKNNETKPLRFESYKEPIKSLEINL